MKSTLGLVVAVVFLVACHALLRVRGELRAAVPVECTLALFVDDRKEPFFVEGMDAVFDEVIPVGPADYYRVTVTCERVGVVYQSGVIRNRDLENGIIDLGIIEVGAGEQPRYAD